MRTLVIVAVVAALAVFVLGCSKKDDPAGPGGGGSSLGSGTVTVNSSEGNLSFSGTGVYPPTVQQSVIAILDTAEQEMTIVGYQLASGTNFNVAALSFHAHGTLSPGEMPIGDSARFFVAYNINLADTAAAYYQAVSGSIVISSVSGTSMSGTFSGEGETSGGATADFTGAFSVVFATGPSPFGDGDVSRSPTQYRLPRR